jgi:hypothetical protein
MLEKCAREGLDVARATGNLLVASNILGQLVIVALGTGDYHAAEQYGREALAIQDAMQHINGASDSKAQLALVRLLQGDLADALTLASEAHAIARKVDYPLYIAQSLAVLALRAATVEEYALGRELGEESLTISTGTFFETILGNWALAAACSGLGDFDSASRHVRAALAPALDLQFTGMALWPLAVAPVILAAEDQNERAVELMGLTFGHPLSPIGWMEAWPRLTVLRAELRAALGGDAFAAAWERGARLSLATAAAEWCAREAPYPPGLAGHRG